MSAVPPSKESVVAVEEIHAFVVRCMRKVGTPPHHATALADLLAAADHRGHYSHGLNRLGRPAHGLSACWFVCRC